MAPERRDEGPERPEDELPEVESRIFSGPRARSPGWKLDVDLPDLEAEDEAAPETRKPGSNRERYVYEGEIGRGGMGAVYRVRDNDLRRTLAMKVAHANAESEPTEGEPSLLDRFLEEAQVTGQLDHPGIVPLHELGIDAKGRVYFTMKLVRGRHLGEVFELAKQHREGWSRERILIVLVRVCEAMAYAHAKGVVHRDLKPANVMTGRFGEVYVMDWGLAKVRGRSERKKRTSSTVSFVATRRTSESGDASRGAMETSHGTVFGTPAYMSPEQARGEIELVDERSDVYSIGAILYHHLVGHAPYAHGGTRVSGEEVLRRLLEGPPPTSKELAPDAPPELTAICDRAMAREPEARYATTHAIADDLRSFLVGRPVSALPLGPVARTVRWCRRNPFAAGLLFAVTAGAGYGIFRLGSLGEDLVEQTALASAAMKTQILQDVNSFYSSQVAGRVDREHTEVTYDYASKKGAIPIPATFLTELGEKISAHTGGVKVRQYSDFPFQFRQPWKLDRFEQNALAELRMDPEKPVYSFEDVDGKPVLRYAIGRRMEPSCVVCHNEHPASPKKDWKVGDVRGVLEIVRPLDEDIARVRKGLRGTMLVVAGIVGGLMLLSAIGIVRASSTKSAGPKA
jgi:serine/threonine protein kinase